MFPFDISTKKFKIRIVRKKKSKPIFNFLISLLLLFKSNTVPIT